MDVASYRSETLSITTSFAKHCSKHILFGTAMVEDAPIERCRIIQYASLRAKEDGLHVKDVDAGVSWALTMLKELGYVCNPAYGMWQLTSLGRRVREDLTPAQFIMELHSSQNERSCLYNKTKRESASVDTGKKLIDLAASTEALDRLNRLSQQNEGISVTIAGVEISGDLQSILAIIKNYKNAS